MKVALMIPLFALFSFISVVSPQSFVYLSPWLDYFEGVALASFFLLLCEYVSPAAARQRDVFFAALEIKDKKSPDGRGNGVVWFRVRLLLPPKKPPG
jgi:hypothetical protein